MSRERKLKILPQLVNVLTAGSRTLNLFFVDLCGSTQYKQDCIAQGQPDINWVMRQNFFLERCADLAKRYDGIIVKTIGDELFAFFEQDIPPDQVLKCGIEIIQSFENVNAYQSKSKLQAKVSIDIGLTYNGSIVDTVPYDPIGSSVDRCARLNSAAGVNQIVISSDFLIALKGKGSLRRVNQKYGFAPHTEPVDGFGEITFYSINANEVPGP